MMFSYMVHRRQSNVFIFQLFVEYTLLLPILAIVILRREKQARRSDIQTMIQVKACGDEGWANYSSQLQKQWK
ncbi:hypothetical protein DICVIV_04489 [Dictyocaulus viviparus]|uniref:Uncharacterized protein n=1 Tax=Dictyocaulus viviparus TaxID=29172 RepID=A0A0D8Y001_DICVI|nr:hypothetical protein DICVIV_04489 [Dictyocaulus viviparus]